MNSILPAVKFDNKLYSFNFKLSKRYEPEISEIIAYGLVSLVNQHLNADGEFADGFAMDGASYVLGDQLSNLFMDATIHKEMCLQCELELCTLIEGASGSVLQDFLAGSTGIVDCFPVAGSGAFTIVMREGYGENRQGSFFSINDCMYAYQEYAQICSKPEGPVCLPQPLPPLDFSDLAF